MIHWINKIARMFGNDGRLFIILFCVGRALALELRPGTPVPHSDELRRMIINYVFHRPSDINGDAILDYVNGKTDSIPDAEKDLKRLNVTLLDPNGLSQLAKFVRHKNWDDAVKLEAKIAGLNGRRQRGWFGFGDPTNLWFYDKNLQQANWINNTEGYTFVRQAVDFMQEAIYTTRYNLKRTKPFRKRYQNNYLFHLGTQFGMLMQIRIKMETTEYTMKTLPYYWTRFHWYLILYERVLQAHVDVTMTVQRMFELYRRLKERRKNPAFAYFYANEMDKDTK